MADQVTAKQSESKFRPHSTGMHVAKCVDIVDFGMCVSDYAGKPKSLSPKCALVFRTGEVNDQTGEVIDLVAEFGVFMSAKAKLRALLESWRGKPYTEEQAREGVPLDKLVGKWAYLNVGQRTSPTSGRTYAVILSANPVPQTVKLPDLPGYSRPEYLTKRKEEYRKAADAYRAEIGVDEHGNPLGGGDNYDDAPSLPDANGDELPF